VAKIASDYDAALARLSGCTPPGDCAVNGDWRIFILGLVRLLDARGYVAVYDDEHGEAGGRASELGICVGDFCRWYQPLTTAQKVRWSVQGPRSEGTTDCRDCGTDWLHGGRTAEGLAHATSWHDGRPGREPWGAPCPTGAPLLGNIAAKIHIVGPNRTWLDSTPLVGPDADYCARVGFTDKRRFCSPVPEGNPYRAECEAAKGAPPTWTVTAEVGDLHLDGDPRAFTVSVVGRGRARARACIGTVCSAEFVVTR